MDNSVEVNAVEKSGETENKYLTFFTADRLYGVSIADVVQIVGMQEITEIPEFPSYAKGIINLRGSIITVIDMRVRLGKEEKEYDERTCIIVTLIKDVVMGFIVDSVDAVTEISSDNISPPPSVYGDTAVTFLTGVAKQGDKMVLIMDIGKVAGNSDSLQLFY